MGENGGSYSCSTVGSRFPSDWRLVSKKKTNGSKKSDPNAASKIDTSLLRVVYSPLYARARTRAYTHTLTHTRTGNLERSSEALPASTFVFKLRTGGRRETSWLNPTPFYSEIPLSSFGLFIVGSLSGSELRWCHRIYLLDGEHVVIRRITEIVSKENAHFSIRFYAGTLMTLAPLLQRAISFLREYFDLQKSAFKVVARVESSRLFML